MIGATFFIWKPEPSSAQYEGFELYQINVHCGDSTLVSKIFTHRVTTGGTVGRPLMGTVTRCAGKKCPGGPVTLDAALAGFPAQVSAGLRAQADKYQENLAPGEDWFLTCLGEGKKPPETKCEKSAPWFDGSSGCTDVQSPQAVAVRGTNGIDVSICGSTVFRGYRPGTTWPDEIEGYRVEVLRWIQDRVGSQICCNKFREAARTRTPCDPTSDIDCDGKSNQTDIYFTGLSKTPFPDINRSFSRGAGADIDPFPAGLDPNDPDFRPERTAHNSKGVGDCACNWELTKGELKCGGGGQGRHVYIATWRCPLTKAEVTTTKYAPATAPCQAPQRGSGLSSLLVRSTSSSVTLFELLP
jgi:hypothetical protein